MGYNDNNPVKKEFGTRKLQKSTWVLITKNILEGTLSKSYEQQKKIMGIYASQGYTLPKVLEVTAALLIYEKEAKKKLLPVSSRTFTRCQESVNNNQWPVAIGGFAAGGLSVSFLNRYAYENYGVVGAWNL